MTAPPRRGSTFLPLEAPRRDGDRPDPRSRTSRRQSTSQPPNMRGSTPVRSAPAPLVRGCPASAGIHPTVIAQDVEVPEIIQRTRSPGTRGDRLPRQQEQTTQHEARADHVKGRRPDRCSHRPQREAAGAAAGAVRLQPEKLPARPDIPARGHPVAQRERGGRQRGGQHQAPGHGRRLVLRPMRRGPADRAEGAEARRGAAGGGTRRTRCGEPERPGLRRLRVLRPQRKGVDQRRQPGAARGHPRNRRRRLLPPGVPDHARQRRVRQGGGNAVRLVRAPRQTVHAVAAAPETAGGSSPRAGDRTHHADWLDATCADCTRRRRRT